MTSSADKATAAGAVIKQIRPDQGFEKITPEHVARHFAAISPDVARRCAQSDGDTVKFVYWHPDETYHMVTRQPEGAEVRYLSEPGKRGLNVHPQVKDLMATDAPVVVIEGTKQYLAGVTALRGKRLFPVGINGIRGWQWKPGKEQIGDAAESFPLPDWGLIPLKGRKVYVVPDGDTHKEGVRAGVDALTGWLESRGAEVRCAAIPLLPGQTNTGLDDYLASVPEDKRQTAALELLETSGGASDKLVDGLSFLAVDEPDEPPLWGHEDAAALWSSGESLFIFGPPGAGKSTLAHLVVFGRLGLVPDVLGFPVRDDGRKVLYLAMDRPKQIMRAMRRLARPAHANTLRDRLIVHPGPLDFNITKGENRNALRDMALRNGVGTIVVDSVKDALPNASDEDAAGAYNLARQAALAAGVEWIELHHNRKANGTNKEPNTLEDVYGSRWLTAGAGSVLSLWQDEPGSPVVALRHIRASGEKWRDTTLILDPEAGTLATESEETLEDFIGRNPKGFTVAQAVSALHKGKAATRGQAQTVRNKLKRLEKRGLLELCPGGSADGEDPFDPKGETLRYRRADGTADL